MKYFGEYLLRNLKNKTNKRAEKYYFSFSFIDNIKSVAILSQIRLIDARRLSYLAGEVSQDDFKVLIAKLKALLP